MSSGEFAEAVTVLDAAQSKRPRDASLSVLRARAFLGLNRPHSAIGALRTALDIEPCNANVLNALNIVLSTVGKPEEALPYGMQAFDLAPNATHATALSALLVKLGRFEQALGFADQAIASTPTHWEALVNRALSLQGLRRHDEGVEAGRRAVETAPDNAVTRFNLGSALLGMGRMTQEAWDAHEWRLRFEGSSLLAAAVAKFGWEGEDISGKTILLHAEQGFGDTIQFVRYAPLVAERARRVVLAVQPALVRLLQHVPGADQVVAAGGPLPPFDVLCPLLSLPRIFGTTLDTIPPAARLPEPFARAWEGEKMLRPRVGIAWSGSKTFRDDQLRSLSAREVSQITGVSGVEFVSLQRHEGDDANPASDLGLIDPMRGVTDFGDTAEVIAGLDLVIAVDTAVAHLAATMNKPVWLLSRWRGCWRWMHDRADSPWYPSIRIFRQSKPNDWMGVIDDIRSELRALRSCPGSEVRRSEIMCPGKLAHRFCGLLIPEVRRRTSGAGH